MTLGARIGVPAPCRRVPHDATERRRFAMTGQHVRALVHVVAATSSTVGETQRGDVCYSSCYSNAADCSGSGRLQRNIGRAVLDSSGWSGLQRNAASPCQGEGRGFESRRPLHTTVRLRDPQH
jgi:hypothetical protein